MKSKIIHSALRDILLKYTIFQSQLNCFHRDVIYLLLLLEMFNGDGGGD